MKRKRISIWFWVAVVVVILAGAAGTWYLVQLNTDRPAYEYLQVQRGSLHITLRESAIVAPEHRLNVTPPIPGRIDSLNVENGAAVKQGQVLAWISSTDRAALMDAARAAGGKEVAFWQDIYKPAPLIAPLDGHIISTAVVPGQVVVTAETVFTMSDHLIVQASVDETDLDHVRLGQPALITFDSFPDANLEGTVHEIAYDATTVNNVSTYVVNIFLKNTPAYVRSGVSANVFLEISNRQNVLRIPTDAVSPEGTVLLVRGKDHQTEVQTVETGPTDGVWTEIVSGLSEGDWIARPVFTVKQASNSHFSLFNQPMRRFR